MKKRLLCVTASLLVSMAFATGGFGQQPQPRPTIRAAQLRPVAFKIVDCPKPPATLPNDIARWATIYCTDGNGQIFAYRDGYYGIFPGNVKRFIVNASGFGGAKPTDKIGVDFAAVTYSPLKKADLKNFIRPNSHIPDFLSKADKLHLLTLKVDNGDEAEMIIADASHDPFWIQPLVDHQLFGQPCYIISLNLLNKPQ